LFKKVTFTLSCRAQAVQPSLLSGRRPGISSRGPQGRGTPRFARGDSSHRVIPRPTGTRDPSLRSGRQKKLDARGDKKLDARGNKKGGLGATNGGLHQFLKQPHSAWECLLKKECYRSPYIPSVVY